MPVLTSVNTIHGGEAGRHGAPERHRRARRDQVVLAYQRYGRGKALAFPVQDSWHWQMDVKMSLEDQTHENYWRQLLRWLVDGVPDAVDVHTLTDRVEPGEPVTARRRRGRWPFVEVNDARVVAKITGPKGRRVEVPMQWTGERNGQYRATFPTGAAGMYSAQVDASRAGKTLGTRATPTCASRPATPSTSTRPCTRRGCERIAEDTGGRFYTPGRRSTACPTICVTPAAA